MADFLARRAIDIKNMERASLNTSQDIALILNNELSLSISAVVYNINEESNVIELKVGTTTNSPFWDIVNELMELIPLVLYHNPRKLPAQVTTFVIKKGNEINSFVWMT